jgi:hypothetical protein
MNKYNEYDSWLNRAVEARVKNLTVGLAMSHPIESLHSRSYPNTSDTVLDSISYNLLVQGILNNRLWNFYFPIFSDPTYEDEN